MSAQSPRNATPTQTLATLPRRPSSTQALQALGQGRSALIEQWHQRCSALGLNRIQRPDFAPLMRSDLNLARERNLRLSSHAAPVMELLAEQIVNTESMIVLTDAQGIILHTVGDDDFLERAGQVALAPGVSWAEHSKGTNAIGTTLFEETPTLVHASEHFMHANNFLTCSAAPIFDPRGNILGVLDVTGDQRSYHRHTMGLVRMSARMIENHWLTDDFKHRLRLHFHHRVEFIGTLLEGIVVVGMDGKLLGANRSALDQLNLSGATLRRHDITSLFGTSLPALVDHFRAPLALPMTLALSDGRQFYGQARFGHAGVHGVGAALAAGNAAAAAPRDGAAPTLQQGEAVADTAAATGQRPSGLAFLLTGDAQIALVVDKVRRVLDRDIALLVTGETGTGKELLARAVHHDSARARHPFVTINCAAAPAAAVEAELFGFEDADGSSARRKVVPGRIVQANGGTLFLDEVGELPLALQARLLRVLQARQITPPGSHQSISIDVAVISATRCNLREMIERGRFREDLYQRLGGLAVRLPALRERSDLLALAQRMLAAECQGGAPRLSEPVEGRFAACPWPGNLHQLSNVLRTAAVLAAGEVQITAAHLSDDLLEDMQRLGPVDVPLQPAVTTTRTLLEQEVDAIRAALAAAHGNVSEAAKRLGISRNTVYRRLRWKRA